MKKPSKNIKKLSKTPMSTDEKSTKTKCESCKAYFVEKGETCESCKAGRSRQQVRDKRAGK